MAEMTPRERLLTALKHEEPDRIPLDLGGLATTIETDPYNELKAYLGIKGETKAFLRDHVAPHTEILEKFHIDTRYIHINPPSKFKIHIEPDNSYVDGSCRY